MTDATQHQFPEGRKPSILVIDDRRINHYVLAVPLKLRGASRVDYAESGEKALEMQGDFAYDIYLIDIGMPGMNGYELSIRLRENLGFATTAILLAYTSATKYVGGRYIDITREEILGRGQFDDLVRKNADSAPNELVKVVSDYWRKIERDRETTRTS